MAFVVMDALIAGRAAASVAFGFRPGHEFGGPLGTGLFIAFIAVGAVSGALAAIVPTAVALRRWGWLPTAAAAIVAGVTLGIPAFGLVATAVWLIDGAQVPLTTHLSELRGLPLIPVFAIGGAIVLSGLARRSRSSRVDPPSRPALRRTTLA